MKKKDLITHDIDASGHIIPDSPLDLRIRNLEVEVERLRGERRYLLNSLYGRVGKNFSTDTDHADSKPVEGVVGRKVKYYDISSVYPSSMQGGFTRPLDCGSMVFGSVKDIENFEVGELADGTCIQLFDEKHPQGVWYILVRASTQQCDGQDVLFARCSTAIAARWLRASKETP